MIITSEVYENRRRELINRIPEGSAVFLFAGKGRPMSQDTDYRFLPDRNFFYLTGLNYEDGRLVIIKEKDGSSRQMLFALQPSEVVERWHGKRVPFEVLSRTSGIATENIFDVEEFDEKVYDLLREYEVLIDGTSIASEVSSFSSSCEVYGDVGPSLTDMRMVKSQEETDAIVEAAVITEEAIDEMKTLIRPGVTELMLYTKLEYEMARRGSLIPAFSTIVSIGTNAFYLHHSEPEDASGAVAKKGDIIQIDVGARYMGYCADISRVFIVGVPDDEEEASRRQKLLTLIRTLRKRAFKFIAPGQTFTTLNQEMRRITGEYLTEWGLLKKDHTDEDVKAYYWHNTSHHMGLDVHDICEREKPFTEGNCLAVEPGVYIKEWGIGFRIEDDVVVTSDGCRLLSSGLDSDESVYVKGSDI